MFPFSLAWTHETNLSSETRILGLCDALVLVISGTCTDSICSSLPHYGPGELVSIPGCCTRAYYFTDKSYGPTHGSRSRVRLTSQDFKDLGVCLRHHTSDRACRLVSHSRYISTLLLMGKSVV